jgi:hypothetical protein
MQLAQRPKLSLAELEVFDPNARQVGHEIRFLCPLGSCGEGKRADTRHRSLSVNLESGLWVCQRCKASGKIREKWAPRERLSPRARAQRAFGLTVPHPARPAAPAPSTSSAPQATKASTWRRPWDQAVPIEGTPGADYLRSRGIPTEIAAAAGVRFVDWQHWTKDELGEWHREATSPRVVFPIQDQVGELVGIQGRAIEARHAGEKVITRGSAGVFSALGTVLDFGHRPRVMLLEAPIDALSIATAGVRDMQLLSTQGTSWPDWLPRALAFGTALLGHDNDEPDPQGERAGDVAAAKLTGELRAFGVEVARRRPSCKDWNELLVKHGVRQVRIEADAEAWDGRLADNLMLYTLEQIARTTAEIPETDAVQALEDQVNASYQGRRLAALRFTLEDYAAAVMAAKGA